MKEPAENYTRFVVIGLILTVLLVAAIWMYTLRETPRLAVAADEFETERVQRGEVLYKDQCVVCHGANGEGGSGPALNNKTILKNTFDHIFFSVIRSGVPGTQMPAWSVDYGGPLTDEDIRDVVGLIRSWEETAVEIVPKVFVADPVQGARLFSDTCAICHGQNGSGTDTAPVLNDLQRLGSLSDDWYKAVIMNGRPAKGMPTWGTVLSPEQVDDLVALFAAWRNGEVIQPKFSADELLTNILYALEQNDLQNAAYKIERAMTFGDSAMLDSLGKAAAEVQAGDIPGARQTILALHTQGLAGDPGAGAAVYTANCAACHGVEGQGGLGPSLLANQFASSLTDAELRQFLLDGRPGTSMVGFLDRLDDAQIKDVIAFLRLWSPSP